MAMKNMDRHYPGCWAIHNGMVRTLLKRAEGIYWFDDGTKSTSAGRRYNVGQFGAGICIKYGTVRKECGTLRGNAFLFAYVRPSAGYGCPLAGGTAIWDTACGKTNF